MKLIRNKTFETNSSSTHAITIPRKLESKEKYSKIFFDIDEFGWAYGKHELKNYIWTAICDLYPNNYQEYKEKLIDILKDYYEEIEFTEPEYDESYDDDGNLKWRYLNSYQGYIDHCRELEDFLDELFNNEELLVSALRNGYVRTGNDNDDGYDLDENNDDNVNYYHYYKGN